MRHAYKHTQKHSHQKIFWTKKADAYFRVNCRATTIILVLIKFGCQQIDDPMFKMC